MGTRIAAIGTLLITGIIIADVLIHPAGTQAAFNGATQLAVPSYNALLGQPSKAA